MHLFSIFNLFSDNAVTISAFILLSGVILVNGWTDAPTAIATCISTKSLSPKKSTVIAALMNFLGVSVMSIISGKVTETITDLADFGKNSETALITLCSSLITIILWAVTAWFFGIPTSESHALIASISGSSVALTQSLSSVSLDEIMKLISGLFISTFSGFIIGYISVRTTEYIIKNKNRIKTDNYFRILQIVGASFMAFMHGAQDGQKFIGVFLLIKRYSSLNIQADINILIIYVSLIMGIGTSIGGMRIIKAMGNDMIKLKKYQGFSADFSGALSILISTLSGLPVSTTHAKTTAIMGVGFAGRKSDVNWNIAKDMILAWIFTFPGCGFLGYLITKLFLTVR